MPAAAESAFADASAGSWEPGVDIKRYYITAILPDGEPKKSETMRLGGFGKNNKMLP
jgi:hypothetical protein